MTRRLILLRHGQTTYNATGRMQGQLDTELSALGREQAAKVGQYFARQQQAGQAAEFPIRRIIASDLSRARETAEIIAEELQLPVTTDSRLRETHLGDWQEQSSDEVDRHSPGARAIWRHDATWTPPGGESRVDVARRAQPVITELMAEFTAWDLHAVLVVAHGGTISALTSKLLGVPVDHYPLLSGLKNTCWSQLSARPVFDPAHPTGAVAFAEVARETGAMPDASWYLDAWNAGVLEG
ncbi:histidine phosphatase family protein [Corynebacterium sp. 3HC-13]|uniref:histidine phosphatase family protein n=1 Tax=Corynebacterium poyangense TaxID=2684405 RepID=UPI001CCD6FAF|nr:histidine phosphatase family protein [Corynebacterium poyangense]MBZ8178341.1 histidine phosphatase family protein [Corynebacterium poyangense]